MYAKLSMTSPKCRETIEFHKIHQTFQISRVSLSRQSDVRAKSFHINIGGHE